MQGTIRDQSTPGYTFGGAQVMFDLVMNPTNGMQYIGYFDHNRDIVIKSRQTKAGTGSDANAQGDGWSAPRRIYESTYNDGSGNTGKKHSYRDEWDIHCWIKLGVDASGNLHVVADHHDNIIRYWRTTTPGDLNTLSRFQTPLVDVSKEDKVSYPEFYNKGGAMKYLIFRDGRSGDGNLVAYKWNNTGKEWNFASKFISGAPTDMSPYWNIVRDDSDVYHIVYNWRDGSGAQSNHTLCYAYTSDFETFKNAAGATLTLPLTPSTTATVVDALPGGRGLANNEYQFGQLGSTKFIAYTKLAEDDNTLGTNDQHNEIHVARWNSTAWTKHRLTHINWVPKDGSGNNIGLTGAPKWFAMGNMFPDNFMSALSSTQLAVDYQYGDPGRPSQRVVFSLTDYATGPRAVVACPQYEPSSAYQPGDNTGMPTAEKGLVAASGFTVSDSRTHEQTNGVVGRGREASQPRDASQHYVAAYQGTARAYFRESVGDSSVVALSGASAVTATYPLRPIVVSKITYP